MCWWVSQDYRIIVSVLVGASGLVLQSVCWWVPQVSYYSQCVGGCLRSRITVSVLVGASGLVLQSVCWWVPQDYRITCLMLRRH